MLYFIKVMLISWAIGYAIFIPIAVIINDTQDLIDEFKEWYANYKKKNKSSIDKRRLARTEDSM